MLRNKLSKLIVSIMTAIMITGAGAGISGQVVKATTVQQGQTTGGQVQAKVVFDITATTTQPEIQNAIRDANTNVIRVGSDVTFSADVINELNTRATPLTIEVVNGGSIVLLTGTSLDGKGNLTISRGTGVTGSLIIVEGDVSISGIKFDNVQGTIISGSTKTPLNKLDLVNNTIDSGQFIDSNLFNNTTATGNNLINGTLAGGAIYGVIIGETTITVKGRFPGVMGDIRIELVDKNTNQLVEAGIVKLDADSKFLHEFKNLTPNTTYIIRINDVPPQEVTTKNVNLKTSVINITTIDATVQIPAGLVPNNQKANLIVKDINGKQIASYPVEPTTSSVVITGLSQGTIYTYDLSQVVPVGSTAITLDNGTFTTLNSSLVTGGGNNGSSTIVTPQITSNDISRSTIKDVTATLEVSNNIAYNSLRDAREIATNVKGITAEFVNGKLELKGLVPEKEYSNLEITYINRDGRKGTIKVSKFTTKKSETKIRQFVTDVYRYALDRLADEEGFAYWVNGLEKKTITPDTLVKNLLNEKEFIEKHKTTEDKINGLYQVIVNRKSDAEGLKFWTNKYDGLIKTGYSDAMALRILVDQMVNEQEFKDRVKDLGL